MHSVCVCVFETLMFFVYYRFIHIKEHKSTIDRRSRSALVCTHTHTSRTSHNSPNQTIDHTLANTNVLHMWHTNTCDLTRAIQLAPHHYARTHFIRHGRIVQLLQRWPLRAPYGQNVAVVVQSRQRLARHMPKAAAVTRIELRLQQLLVVLVARR